MEQKLKRVIGRTDVYLDLKSATDGFRDLCLVGLIEHNEAYNEQAGTNIPSMCEQVTFIKEYLEHSSPGYELIPGWDSMYFIAKEAKIDSVKDLLEKHPKPSDSREGGKALGLILGFSECCVDAHLDEDNKTVARCGFDALPIVACSDDCNAPWDIEYNRLADLYGIDISKWHIDGNS